MEKGTVIFFIFGIIPVTGVIDLPVYRRPKMIVHVEQTSSDPKTDKDIIETFSRNMKLTKNETKLLVAYSQFKPWFRPATKLVCQVSGLQSDTVKYLRNKLHELNIIYVDSDHIYLRWGDYRSICLADPFMMQDGLKGRLKLEPFINPMRFENLTDEEVCEYFYNEEKLHGTLANIGDKAADELCKQLVNYKNKMMKESWEEVYFRTTGMKPYYNDEEEPEEWKYLEDPFKDIPLEDIKGDDLPF